MSNATAFFSITYNGLTWSTEYPMNYGGDGQYGQRFIAMRLGAVQNYMAFRFRGVTPTRVAFAAATINVG